MKSIAETQTAICIAGAHRSGTSMVTRLLHCCGLELGPTSLSAYSAMVNLIGSTPPEGSFDQTDGVHLHLYGKASRPGRKLGHVTVIGPDPDTRDRVLGRVTQTADNQ